MTENEKKSSGFFGSIEEDIKKLNASVSDLASQEKATKLRKKLILWGAIIAVIGFSGVLICFALFIVGGFSLTSNFRGGMPDMTVVVLPMLLTLPFALVAGMGSTVLKLGLSILIGGETSKFIDKAINNRCECGHTIKQEEKFCSKCGREIRKTCSCGTLNEPKASFCKSCGNKLK